MVVEDTGRDLYRGVLERSIKRTDNLPAQQVRETVAQFGRSLGRDEIFVAQQAR